MAWRYSTFLVLLATWRGIGPLSFRGSVSGDGGETPPSTWPFADPLVLQRQQCRSEKPPLPPGLALMPYRPGQGSDRPQSTVDQAAQSRQTARRQQRNLLPRCRVPPDQNVVLYRWVPG